jgi:RND family efflux transporter MFP subunit
MSEKHSKQIVLNEEALVSTLRTRSRSTWWIALVLFVFAVLIALGILGGIHSRIEAQTTLHEIAKESAVPFVEIVRPKASTTAQEIALPGNTQAFNDTPIYARTSGYVKEWYVDIGTRVKQGELLATIETPELDHQLEQARADLKTAEANLQIADITAARWQHLVKTNSVSQQETDQATFDLSAKKALVDANRANVDRLEQLQSYERVIAPFDGVITARNTDVGALIQAGDNTAPKELFRLAAKHTLRVYISVPEIYASSVKNDSPAMVTLDAFPNQTLRGTIVRNANAIDLNSRTLNVEVDVDNPSGRLFPGAYAFVHLKLPAGAHGVTIPTNALLFRSEGLRAGVVHNDHVTLTPITIGEDYGSTVEIRSGLTPNDAVIVNLPILLWTEALSGLQQSQNVRCLNETISSSGGKRSVADTEWLHGRSEICQTACPRNTRFQRNEAMERGGWLEDRGTGRGRASGQVVGALRRREVERIGGASGAF